MTSTCKPLTYAYKTQVHHRTNASPYSHVLSQQPLRPSLLRAKTNKMPTATDKPSRQAMQKLLHNRIVCLRAKRNASMRESKSRYKLDYYRWIREIHSSTLRQYVSIDRQSSLSDCSRHLSGSHGEAHVQHIPSANQRTVPNIRCPTEEGFYRRQWQTANPMSLPRRKCAFFVSTTPRPAA